MATPMRIIKIPSTLDAGIRKILILIRTAQHLDAYMHRLCDNEETRQNHEDIEIDICHVQTFKNTRVKSSCRRADNLSAPRASVYTKY